MVVTFARKEMDAEVQHERRRRKTRLHTRELAALETVQRMDLTQA
jgi:hypothetical protein